MNFKLDIWTIIGVGAIVLASTRLLTGNGPGTIPGPVQNTPDEGPIVAPINDDEYSDILDDELFDGITA